LVQVSSSPNASQSIAMAMRLLVVGLYTVSLLKGSAADGHLASQSKWRACSGYASNIAYVTGIGVEYAPSWAGPVFRSELLNAGMSSAAELEAACDALLVDGQIGEIYEMSADNAGNNCTTCLRMAIYSATEGGLLVGTLSDTGSQAKWVCGKGVPPPAQPSCTVAGDSKWRACSGYATNIAYITGVGLDYSPGWAGAVNRSELLNAGMSSDAELDAACDALLADGQIGEIYEMSADNADGCINCLRMAIYSATEEGLQVGTVSDTGAQAKWVCGKGGRAPVQPPCPEEPMTCGDVKDAFRAGNCCGNLNAPFSMEGTRRMTASTNVKHTASVATDVQNTLTRVKTESRAKAGGLEKKIQSLLKEYNTVRL